jgi:hypothetical protein
MSLPPPTAGQSQQPQQPQQRVFFRSTGKTVSESRLQQMFIEMMTTVKQGGKIAKATHHENLWMLSQHQPTHPLLKGKHVPPPENTSPALLEEMYSKKEVQVFKEYYERQRAKAGPSNVASQPQYTPQALPQSAPSIHTFEPDPSVAAAREKVKSGKYDFSWSEENEELSRPPSDGELSRMGCTREKDGWRAPSPEGLTQERADLEWAMQNV